MKKIFTSIIKYFIERVKRNKFVQNLFEAPFELNKFNKMGDFKDSSGNTFELLAGLRTKIKPGWQNMLKTKKADITKDYLAAQKSNGLIAINKIIPILNSLGKSFKDSTVLEIGCHSGATSYAIAERKASEVIGSEFSGYKIQSVKTGNEGEQDRLMEVNDNLKRIRTELASYFKHADKVKFIDDDICNSNLPQNSFDIICSWDVLEHLHDPGQAFHAIYKLLKQDGITIHEYNPFFSLNGGHSLCTLDFLWGHIRLSDSDFSKYLDDVRPQEKEKALSFYRSGLNRMTLYDVKQHLHQSGLETISIIPFTKEQHLKMVDKEILDQSTNHYPDVTLLDLSSPRVIVIARKSN